MKVCEKWTLSCASEKLETAEMSASYNRSAERGAARFISIVLANSILQSAAGLPPQFDDPSSCQLFPY